LGSYRLIVAPLAHDDGAVLSRLFGSGGDNGLGPVGEGQPKFWQKWI
jgi:hypothetical protein